MQLRVTLSLLLICAAPATGVAQQPLVRTPPPVGVAVSQRSSEVTATARSAANDSAQSSFDRNVIRAAALGGAIGGLIGAVASEHQAVGVGFTHTPAVLFVVTYGGLGVLLGLIAGTMLPGS